MGVDQILTDLAKGSGLPTQAPAFVDQQRTHALGEIVMDTAADRRLVFGAEDVGAEVYARVTGAPGFFLASVAHQLSSQIPSI